jgi:hypothetical protein
VRLSKFWVGKPLRHLLALLGVFWTAPVVAQSLFTGNDFLATCVSSQGEVRGICHGYIIGMDGFWTYGNLSKQMPETTCRPKGTTFEQMYDIFVSFLQRNPSQRHFMTPSLYVIAIEAAFPCASTPSPQRR